MSLSHDRIVGDRPRGLMVSLDSPGAISRRGKVAVGVAAVVYIAAAILALVYGSVHWPVAPAVMVGHSVGMFIAATVTALLLLTQAGVTGRRAYAILGATYLFVALVMLAFPLTIPGAFRGPDPLTGDPRSIIGGGQSAVWLFYLWQSSFFVGILIGALVYWHDNVTLRRPGLRWGVRRIIGFTFIAAAIPIGVIVLAPKSLPVILDPTTGKSTLLVIIDVCLLILGLAVCAVTVLQARRGSVMNLFLAAVGLTALGMVLPKLTTDDRWTVGWYSTRVFTLVSMASLMVLLIVALSKIDRVSTWYAEQDTLTGLLRRGTFDSRLRFELQRMATGGGHAGLLWVNLDEFKSTNDRLGQQAGDEVLRVVGHRLRSAMAENDLAARLGGDEFGVLCVDLTEPEELDGAAERIRDALREPFEPGEATILLTASVGALPIEAEGTDPGGLLHRANLAMFAAKAAGGDRVTYYSPEMEAFATSRAELRSRLAQAMLDHDFDMDYQPIIDVSSGAVVGVEALVRWLRDGRRVSAGEFIPTMEATGQLPQLGRMIRELIAVDLPHLVSALPSSGGFVTLNLAIAELEDDASVDRMLEGPLRGFAAPVTIEVLESDDLTPNGPADRNLDRLRSAGYSLAIDDFGTGYSNFSLLKRLQPEILKLDRSLLARSEGNAVAAADFLDAATRIGHAVGARVLAEGVENEQDVARIIAAGVDLAQGYHYARPAPLPDVLRFIEEGKAPHISPA